MVRYYINDVEIQEPIGYDEFETTISRHDFHGATVENSVGDLEFYGYAFDMIKAAYNYSIDSSLIFRSEIDYVNDYVGLIDLSTYEEQKGKYCSCKVKVSETGAKITFNNRIDTDVNINSTVSIDGTSMTSYPNLKTNITIPAKGIFCRSTMLNLSVSDTFGKNINDSIGVSIMFPFYNPTLKDLEGFYESSLFGETLNNFDYYFYKNVINIPVKIRGAVIFKIKTNVDVTLDTASLMFRRESAPTTPFYTYDFSPVFTGGVERTVTINFDFNTTLNPNEKVVAFIRLESPNPVNLEATAQPDSTVTIEGVQTLEESTANVAMIHETLSRVSEAISGITVRSDYYGRNDSDVNPTSTIGRYALKCLTLGYWLRNAKDGSNNDFTFNISFKDLFNSLNAIDNIGWGFSIESGTLYLRVEPKQWFYKDAVLMTINNPEYKSRKINPQTAFTRLNIGYDKYESIEETNSIDTFHTQRKFITGIKSIDNELNMISKFIADPFAIEFTRRQSLTKSTDSWKYDENVFVIALKSDESFVKTVDIGVEDDEGIRSPATLINSRLTPINNASKHIDTIFEVNTDKTTAVMQSGTGNLTAGYLLLTESGYTYLQDPISDAGVFYWQNRNLSKTAPILKSELIEFEYPICKSDYLTILANPYGKVYVDGVYTYIKEFKYKRSTGLATFKVIPKY